VTKLTERFCEEPLLGLAGDVQLVGLVQYLLQGERVVQTLHVPALHVTDNPWIEHFYIISFNLIVQSKQLSDSDRIPR
jgi:hypothetical protein